MTHLISMATTATATGLALFLIAQAFMYGEAKVARYACEHERNQLACQYVEWYEN